MKCPRCKDKELQVQTKGEGQDIVEVDLCSSCGGLWLDSEELNQLDDNFFLEVETIEYKPSDATASDAQLACPRCTKVMDKVHPDGFPEVVLDTCSDCKGFWLDKGELEKMKDVSDRMLIKSLME